MSYYTEKDIEDIKPQLKRFRLSLGKSIYLEIYPNGRKYFIWKYRYPSNQNGNVRDYQIGPYGSKKNEWTLEKAFNERNRLEKLKKEGIDPRISKKDSKQKKVILFREISQEWLIANDEYLDELEIKINKKLIDKVINPSFGNKSIFDISKEDCHQFKMELEQGYSNSQTNSETNKIIEIVNNIFLFAIDNKSLEFTNPMPGYFQKRYMKDELDDNNNVVAPYPKNALVEISNGCNHKCLFCNNTLMQRKVGKLELELFEKFIYEVSALGLEEVGLYSTGEPFINRDLHLYIKIAKDAGLKRVYLTSNGALADLDYVKKCIDNGLNSIKFSINASNKEDYFKVHGKDDWDKVVTNIKSIYEYKIINKKDLELLGSCVMTKITGNIIKEHEEIFGKYFIDTAFTFAVPQVGKNIENIAKISNPAKENNIDSISPCSMLWKRWHVTSEGYLTCCCADYENDLVFSDLRKESPSAAWNNKLIQELRYKHLTKSLNGTLCFSCLTNKKSDYGPISDIPMHKNISEKAKNKNIENYYERLNKI